MEYLRLPSQHGWEKSNEAKSLIPTLYSYTPSTLSLCLSLCLFVQLNTRHHMNEVFELIRKTAKSEFRYQLQSNEVC